MKRYFDGKTSYIHCPQIFLNAYFVFRIVRGSGDPEGEKKKSVLMDRNPGGSLLLKKKEKKRKGNMQFVQLWLFLTTRNINANNVESQCKG